MMATFDVTYPRPVNPTGFGIINPNGKTGVITYWHGIGEIGTATDDPWGLQGLINSGGLPVDLINMSIVNDFVLVAARCDRLGGWSNQMVNDVLDHPAVRAYDKNKIHSIGFSLGGGLLANYMLTSQGNAERFATAHVAYMTPKTGIYANIANAKVVVVGITATNDNNGGTPPQATRDFVKAINAAGGKATLKEFTYGAHGGALVEYFKDQKTYDFMIANPRGGAVTIPPPPVKTISKVVIHYSDGTTVEQK